LSLRNDRKAYEEAYARRSALTWATDPSGDEARVRDWSRNVLVVASSPSYGGQIASLFDSIEHRHCYVPGSEQGETTEYFGGFYRGRECTVMHLGITPGARGASYMDMGLERLRYGRCEKVVLIGEGSSIQPDVKVGDLVVALVTIPEDDIHKAYSEGDTLAMADHALCAALRVEASQSRRVTHCGVCWSCGAGAGVFDPALSERAFELHELGVMANTLEASTAYTLGKIIGFRVASLWLMADSIFEPIQWSCLSPQLSWEDGWEDLVRAGLDTLVRFQNGEGVG
jgi:purine-nucleoside phosphorylase